MVLPAGYVVGNIPAFGAAQFRRRGQSGTGQSAAAAVLPSRGMALAFLEGSRYNEVKLSGPASEICLLRLMARAGPRSVSRGRTGFDRAV